MGIIISPYQSEILSLFSVSYLRKQMSSDRNPFNFLTSNLKHLHFIFPVLQQQKHYLKFISPPVDQSFATKLRYSDQELQHYLVAY